MDDAKFLCETAPVESPAGRQQSAAMILELQAHQAVLNGLSNWYSVFAFTGGMVPSGRCELVAINAYLECPFAADCISTEEVKHYRRLIKSIMIPREGVDTRPRTRRDRRQIADSFGRAAAEIRSMGSRFESALVVQGQPVPL
jgi:hypothetical protein